MPLSDNSKSALMMAGSMAAFTCNDAIMKFITTSLPLASAVTWRGLLTSIFLAILAWRMGALTFQFTGKDRWLIAARSVAEVATTFFFLRALALIPLANATAIMQALPLTVTLAAALFLKEPLGWRRLTAIGVGFIGMLFIVQPGGDSFSAASIYAVIAMALVTVRDLTSRRLSKQASSLSVALIGSTAVTIAFGAQAVAEGAMLPALNQIALILLAAICILVGYVFSIMTIRIGDIAAVAPFRYTSLVVSLILGWLIFGDFPGPMTLLGAAIVVATGIYTLYRERRLARQHGPHTPITGDPA